VRSTEEVSSTQQESDPDWEIVENESVQSNVECAVQVWAVLSLLGYFCELCISVFRAQLTTLACNLSCYSSSARFKCKHNYWDTNWLTFWNSIWTSCHWIPLYTAPCNMMRSKVFGSLGSNTSLHTNTSAMADCVSGPPINPESMWKWQNLIQKKHYLVLNWLYTDAKNR